MDNMTNYLKNKVLNTELSGSYVTLFNNDVEVVKASYKRQPCTFTPANNGQVSDSNEILFPIANEKWDSITHIGLFDSLTGGNMLFKASAEFIKNIDVSSQYKVPKNYLIIRLR